MKKKLLRLLVLIILAFFAFLVIYFPGKRLPIAITLATGIGKSSLQAKIDACEDKAILKQEFTEQDIEFRTYTSASTKAHD